jgi:hypothetical protein
MSDKPVVQRMFIKPGYALVILNTPPDYLEVIGDLPEKVLVTKKLVANADIVQLFTKTQVELNELFPKLKKALKDDGSLWITYPKGTSKVATDINRDIIWQIGKKFGLKPVALISIDSKWASLRMKKADL